MRKTEVQNISYTVIVFHSTGHLLFCSVHDAGNGKTFTVVCSDERNLEKHFGIKSCLGNRNTIKDKNTLLTG